MKPLRVVAISAPELPEGGIGKILNSEDPASLFNACRCAAQLAELQVGAWGDSNWTGSRHERRKHILLMRSLKEDLPLFEQMIDTVRPNLLLIGSMSVCFPGAIACARRAKELLGNSVCVVLGGKHVNETMFLGRDGSVIHHPGSPLRLMAENHIEPIFDLVVAGEGEYVITWVGERIFKLEQQNIPPAHLPFLIDDIESVPGNWIGGWIDSKTIHTRKGFRTQINRDELPIPCELFGVKTTFHLAPNSLTAHVFSDSGAGCVFDCNFCSERQSVNGPMLQLETAAKRLYRQLKTAERVIKQDAPEKQATAFVEDSTLLAGSPHALNTLIKLLHEQPLTIRFGAQLTIDQITSRTELLRQLKEVGLDYLFVGIETPDPEMIGGMSKSVKNHEGSWQERIERALIILNDLNINCGAALVFGMGETHQSRMQLLNQIQKWRPRIGLPNIVSMNWAVQHPLKGHDDGVGYQYTQWAIPAGSPFLTLFRDWGEASLVYPFHTQPLPTEIEIEEINTWKEQFDFIARQNTSQISEITPVDISQPSKSS